MRNVDELRKLMVLEEVPMECIITSDVKIREVHEDDPGLRSLILSVGRNGVIQPTFGRPVGDGPQRELIDGLHRWFASGKNGRATLPMQVIPGLTDDEARTLQFTLNVATVNQSKKEQRDHIKVYMTHNPLLSKRKVATAFSMSPQQLSNVLALEKLIPSASAALDEEAISFSHGLVLARVPAEVQNAAMDHIGLPIEDFNTKVKELNKEFKTGIKAPEGPTAKLRTKDSLIEEMERLNHCVETSTPSDEDYVANGSALQAIKWTLQLDDASLKERESKKAAKSTANLEKREAATLAKLKKMEEQMEKLRAEKAEISGIA